MKKLLLSLLVLALPVVVQAQIAFALTGNYAMGSNSVTIGVADINGDGKLDLIVRDKNILVLTNDGNGRFGSNSLSTGGGISSICMGDVNADGYPDLIGSDGAFSTGHIFVYTNNHAGGFGSNAAYNVGSVPGKPLIADINNDGKPDIICPNAAGKSLSILTNNGSGGFNLASTPATGSDGNPTSVVAVDINNDGKMELICANAGTPLPGTTLSVLTNGGNGVFKLSVTPNVGANPVSIVVTDINGDGRMDLWCACSFGKTFWALTNNGSGSFGSNSMLSLSFSPTTAVAADFNGDGKLDWMCSSSTSNLLLILTNNGNGILRSNMTISATRPEDLIAADINGDGSPDFICVNDGLHPINPYTSRSAVSVYESIPKLGSVFLGGNLILSWPTAWTNWTLWQSSDLTASSWTSFGGTIFDDGTTKSVTNSLLTGNSFFRLSHP